MVEQQSASILVGQSECRTCDRLLHPKTTTEPLCETGLAGPEIAGENQEITGSDQISERDRNGLRLVWADAGHIESFQRTDLVVCLDRGFGHSSRLRPPASGHAGVDLRW